MKSCPTCNSANGLREILYGMPIGPVDEEKYSIGGCCISDNDPTLKCIECGWKGEFVNNIGPVPMILESLQRVDTSVLERLSVEILTSIPKEESKYAPLTAELSASWDKMVEEIKEIKAMGYTVDIVSEIPEVEIPKAHCVIFVGSSLLGVMTGDDNFLQSFGFLQKKSNEGKLQCFHWWCEECKTNPLKKGATPINHLVKISFPNVLKLIGDYKVQWKWEEPESEWAKSQGSPIEQFKKLVTKNSRPNWKVLVR
jgi:hypothetical protein